MLDTKDILTKSVSTLIVGAVIGGSTMAYNSISKKLDSFNATIEAHPHLVEDIERLNATKDEMEKEYKDFKKYTSRRLKKDSTNIKYVKEWVDYWVSLRNN